MVSGNTHRVQPPAWCNGIYWILNVLIAVEVVTVTVDVEPLQWDDEPSCSIDIEPGKSVLLSRSYKQVGNKR